MKMDDIDWEFRDLFPFANRILERQVKRIRALKSLQERHNDDEETQLEKISARDKLKTLVELERYK